MKTKNIEHQAFFELLKAGLRKKACVNINVNLAETTDWHYLYRLAQEQSVQGIVLSGLEELSTNNANLNIPKELLLQWIGEVQIIEQSNKEMNRFVADLIARMRDADIYAILVKGQGVAQCYESPFWRSSGDVDLLLSDNNYDKAKQFLLPLSDTHKSELQYTRHLGLTIESWYVELHGSMRTGLSAKVDKVVDEVQRDVFYGGNVRSWNNGGTPVFLPSSDNDVIFIFTHILQHFYKETLGLKQLCDWCRLLWTYRESLNRGLLESRIKKAGIIREWKAFASLAVDYLGMPVEAMPLYDDSSRWSKKALKLIDFILNGYTGSAVRDTFGIAKIFPWKTFCYLPSIFLNVNSLKIRERIFQR